MWEVDVEGQHSEMTGNTLRFITEFVLGNSRIGNVSADSSGENIMARSEIWRENSDGQGLTASRSM